MFKKIMLPMAAVIAVALAFTLSSFGSKEITSVNEKGFVTYQFTLKNQSFETTSANRRNPANYNYKGTGEVCPSGTAHQCVIYAERIDTDMDGIWEPVIPGSGTLYNALDNNGGALPLPLTNYVELKP